MAESAISFYEDDNFAGVLHCIAYLYILDSVKVFSQRFPSLFRHYLFSKFQVYDSIIPHNDSVCLRNNRSLLYLDMYARGLLPATLVVDST